MGDGLKRARAAAKATPRPPAYGRRHPVEVTSDRLAEHYEKLHDRFAGDELDAISKVRHALLRIADEDEQEAVR